MSATGGLLVVVVAWLAIGVAASIVMGRRGHHPFTWGALGAVLGPLVVPLAVQDVRREREARALVLTTPQPPHRGIEVLVGVDGSPESCAAIDAVVDMLGERLGGCTLAAVVDVDTALAADSWPEREHAEGCLGREAERVRALTGREPGRVVLAGRPADALREYAQQASCDMLVVGSRGRGASKMLFGSVASELARGAPVPVFVVSVATRAAEGARAR